MGVFSRHAEFVQVHLNVTEQSLVLHINLQDKLMSLQIDHLYSQVIPERCTTSVRSGGRRVLITLYKVSDQDWRFLKA